MTISVPATTFTEADARYHGVPFNGRATQRLQIEIGQRFDHLVVIGPGTRGSVWWRVRCDCGNEKEYQAFNLVMRTCCGRNCTVGGPHMPRNRSGERARIEVADPGEWCRLCYGPADRTVIGPSGRTPVCNRCRNASRRPGAAAC
jgi:hypothetical protein